MDHFNYCDDRLFAESVSLATIAEQVGTPCYVYSRAMIEQRWHAFDDAFEKRDHMLCYAVKANSNLGVLSVLARLGCGFDIVSGGELERVLKARGDPAKVVFSGVGKSEHEIRRALEVGIYCFNVESETELVRLNALAADSGRRAPTALRVNPDVDPNTHPYIATGLKQSKFGIPIEQAAALYAEAHDLSHIEVAGIACHIGSQLVELAPFLDALDRVIALVESLKGQDVSLRHLDLGGGLGIRYRDEQPPSARDYVVAMTDRLAASDTCRDMRVLIEPGRSLVGEAGLLLTRVLYLKQGEVKNFAIIDGAMNDLLRPALYDAWHDIVPVSRNKAKSTQRYDVVGPVCESADFIGRDRELAIAAGDLLAVRSAGAYGACMSSRYNSRALPAEVIVDGDQFYIVRRRERIDDMLAMESVLPD
jgi:diaminopimelate decarboxylase